jgi:hypothetical protein
MQMIVHYRPTSFSADQTRVPVSLPAPPWATDAKPGETRVRKPSMCAEDVERSKRADRIIAVLRRNGEAMTARDVAKVMHVSVNDTSNLLRAMAKDGRILRADRKLAGTLFAFYSVKT